MSLTIVVLFEAEVLMRFQDIFYQDSVLLKFWLVLLEFNFLTTRSISCTYTCLYKLTFMHYMGKSTEHSHNRFLGKTALNKVILLRIF